MHFALCMQSILKGLPGHKDALRKILNYELPFKYHAKELIARYERFGYEPPKMKVTYLKYKPVTELADKNILRDVILPRIEKLKAKDVRKAKLDHALQYYADYKGQIPENEKAHIKQLQEDYNRSQGLLIEPQDDSENPDSWE